MLEISSLRKNKVNLLDYNSQQDIENRILMANFSTFDVEVMEEILYSHLKISTKKLARSLGCEEADLSPFIYKLVQSGLLSQDGDSLTVDKEMRKYFEFHMNRFEEAFRPDVEFLQGLLKRVPIHILPIWYSVSRTTNNIFESIIEKYLLTPQIFYRYIMELNFSNTIFQHILDDVFNSENFAVSSSDLIEKYNLPRQQFEEILLQLEFNFLCCVSYKKEDDHWLELVTPFQEWKEYLQFLRDTDPPTIESEYEVERTRNGDFAFVNDSEALLRYAKKKPIPISSHAESLTFSDDVVGELSQVAGLPLETAEDFAFASKYFSQCAEKLCHVKLADVIDGKIYALDSANDWIDMTPENRALHIYRHPLNQILTQKLSTEVETERNIREAEKSIKRILHGKWVYFDDFIKGVLVPLNEDSVVMLKKMGRHWKYTLPVYSDDEKTLIKATVFEWLFETGIVATGHCDGKDCFAVTAFGRFFFEN